MTLVARASWRRLRRHRWQMALLIIGVALGVAVVVAVDIANDSARRAFALSLETVAGRATHQIVGGPAGLDEQVYVRLRTALGVRAAAPVIEAYGRAGDETLHLLGIDPFAEGAVRAHLEDAGDVPLRRLLAEPDAALLSETTANRLGLVPDARLSLTLGGREQTLTIVGLIADSEGGEGLLVTDIASAQERTGMIGRLSWIDLVLPDDEAGAGMHRRIAQALPPGASLVETAARAQTLTQMTAAFRTNLTAMSLLALVVGMFLIYNTMTFAVLQRRTLIGTLRTLGVTRRGIFALILREALLLGLVGTLLGLALGVVLGQGLMQLVTRTINDIYFVLAVRDVPLSLAPLIKGLVLGLAATLLAALLPAFEAARTTPRLALSRSAVEARVHGIAPRLALVGVAMMLAALLLLVLPLTGLVAGFVALFLLILGLTLLAPAVVALFARGLSSLLRAGTASWLLPRLAVRGIETSLSRTGVAIAALMLAVATTIGVGVMVASFRASVEVWLDSTLRADIYVSAPTFGAQRTPANLDPAIIERLRRIAGVDAIAAARYATVETPTGMIDLLALDIPRALLENYLVREGEARAAYGAFDRGEAVLVTEPYAYRHGVSVGDVLTLPTARGSAAFPIAAVLVDYSSEQGMVVMPHTLYRRHFADDDLSSLRLYLAADADLDAVLAHVRATTQGGQEVIIRSNRALRALSLEIFDRTFTITNVLRLLAVLVAFVGILSALMALQLERAREFAILRATGFTPTQVQGLVSWQTGLMGLLAGVLAIPVGLVLALVLIHVINRRAFGWTMQTFVPMEMLVQAVLLAVLAALMAGLYPGFRLAHASPARALREE